MSFIYGVTLSRVGERQESDFQKSEIGRNNVKGIRVYRAYNFSCSLTRMSGKQKLVTKIERS